MPTPNSEFDQSTGLRYGDINRIIVAFLNRVFDASGGFLRMAAGAAPNLAISQATLGIAAIQIASSRVTRRSLVIKNLDSSIKVYIGTTNAVSSSNGMELKAGESWVVDAQSALWAIAASGSPLVSLAETYD